MIIKQNIIIIIFTEESTSKRRKLTENTHVTQNIAGNILVALSFYLSISFILPASISYLLRNTTTTNFTPC